MAGIEEAGDSILPEGDGSRMQVHLHEKGTVVEDHGEKQPQDMDGRNPLQFIAVCDFEDLTNYLVLVKKTLVKKTVRFFRNKFRRMAVLCYTVHNMSFHFL